MEVDGGEGSGLGFSGGVIVCYFFPLELLEI